jgi:hypothetical protein
MPPSVATFPLNLKLDVVSVTSCGHVVTKANWWLCWAFASPCVLVVGPGHLFGCFWVDDVWFVLLCLCGRLVWKKSWFEPVLVYRQRFAVCDEGDAGADSS